MMETEEPTKEIDLEEVVVKGEKPADKSSLFERIGDFFGNLFRKKAASASEEETKTTTNQQNNMAAGAIVATVSQAVGSVFGFLVKGKELKIEEENTEQLKLQLEAAEDAALQETLQKKLDVQLTQLNAAAEADRLRRIGSLATTFAVLGLIGLIIVQVFRYKREKEKPQPPVIIQS